MGPFPYRKPFWAAAVVAALAAGFVTGRRLDAVAGEDTGGRAPARASDWLAFLQRLYERIANHRITSIAGGVTFFVLLALFPAIAALVSIYGLFWRSGRASPRSSIPSPMCCPAARSRSIGERAHARDRAAQ